MNHVARSSRLLPILRWGRHYDRANLRGDLVAGVTVSALLVPQGLAYALLAGLPPQVGLYASIVPVLVYAALGTSRQLALGPVAIVSLMTATALSPLYDEGTPEYLAGAALLALLVGLVHLVLRVGRLAFVVNFLSHSVLVGFTAASAIIIVASQVKHVLGISIPRTDAVLDTAIEVGKAIGDTHGPTVALAAVSIAAILGLKRISKRIPGALIVLLGSIAAVELFDLDQHGVKVVGDIPSSLPGLSFPSVDGGALGALTSAAIAITLVGFMESIAVAKVYARRHRYEIDPDQELTALGMANIASGLFGAMPVTGGFSRTAVSDSAGTRTPLASIVAAILIVPTVLFLTPVFASLPQAALGATIMVAVVNLVDVAEMRHIAHVKRSDLVGLGVAFVATLVLGIERGMVVAIVASMLVVFARMSKPHSAVLGRIPGTTNYRNVTRFPDVEVCDGVRIVRIDAALSFVNAQHVKRLCLDHAAELATDDSAGGATHSATGPRALVLDCSGINDIDATGADVLGEIVTELDASPVQLHLADVKGPVRDVLHRAGLWSRLDGRIHATDQQAVDQIEGRCGRPSSARAAGIDERDATDHHADHHAGRPVDQPAPSPALTPVAPELERTVSP